MLGIPKENKIEDPERAHRDALADSLDLFSDLYIGDIAPTAYKSEVTLGENTGVAKPHSRWVTALDVNGAMVYSGLRLTLTLTSILTPTPTLTVTLTSNLA